MQLANVPKHSLHTVYSLFHPGAYVVNVPQKGWKIAMNANAVKIEGFMHELHSFEVVEEVSDVWGVQNTLDLSQFAKTNGVPKVVSRQV